MRRLPIICGLLSVIGLSGCTSTGLFDDYGAIPVNRLPVQLLNGERKESYEDVSFLRLRQDPPQVYKLDAGDILGIYIENILGGEEALPPVQFRDETGLPPAIGYPVPIREDGTIALPLIEPINLQGLGLVEATNKIRDAYIRGEVLQEGKDGTIVTLIKQRTTRVTVIREEAGSVADVTKRGTGTVVDLPAYENDVLHALNMTGGLPGTDAKNEVLIYRGLYNDSAQYEQVVTSLCQNNDPCFCDESPRPDPPNLIRIPLRYNPATPPTFTKDDVILQEGDIVVIRARDNEVYYTGGLLGGGEHLLPRDRDLDVMAAIAVTGGTLGRTGTGVGQIGNRGGGGLGGFGGGGGQFCDPSQLVVLRKLPCGQQLAIKVDLDQAIRNPAERILVQPNDILILRYTLKEEIGNLVLGLAPSFLIGNGLRR
ncbi:MAG: polysaccharide biosynthesis/export family protein [Planctomycetaceae bacterium]